MFPTCSPWTWQGLQLFKGVFFTSTQSENFITSHWIFQVLLLLPRQIKLKHFRFSFTTYIMYLLFLVACRDNTVLYQIGGLLTTFMTLTAGESWQTFIVIHFLSLCTQCFHRCRKWKYWSGWGLQAWTGQVKTVAQDEWNMFLFVLYHSISDKWTRR